MPQLEALAEYPFHPHFAFIDGHRMAYLDEGRGPVIVMLHGNPSWSYLYRNLVGQLKNQYRCIVPDHLGCGFSDKPQNATYTLQAHIDRLELLLNTLQIERCVLMVHDWGGAIGMGWAARHVGKISGFIVCNTAAFPFPRIPWRIAVCRWPLLGPLLVRGANAFARAAVHMATCKKMLPEVARSFLAPYNSWANRIAILRFVDDIPMQPSHPSWPSLLQVEAGLLNFVSSPMLICWGGADFCFNHQFYSEWLRRFPRAEAHYFPEASHYLLEDALEEITPHIARFLVQINHAA